MEGGRERLMREGAAGPLMRFGILAIFVLWIAVVLFRVRYNDELRVGDLYVELHVCVSMRD
jgi:hypothetical protein